MNLQKPREIAFHVLLEREKGRAFIENLLEDRFATVPLSGPDRALVQEIVYGVVRWKRPLEFLIDRKTSGRTQKAGLRLILSMGLYQLFWLDRVPAHAAVHESVELAKRAGFGPQAGFVNAILRGAVREIEPTKLLLTNLAVEDPALALSHPQWLYERWRTRYGNDDTLALMRWNNDPPPTFARLNSLKGNTEGLKSAWDKQGVHYSPKNADWAPDGSVFELTGHPPLRDLPSFKQGMFYLQDPSTLLAVHELEPKPGEKILDLCAAPGGKTSFVAQQMQNRGLIVASDSDSNRLSLIQENCDRLGIQIVQTASLDGATIAQNAPYDRILADVPCSNTGVMRRRLDLRWRIRETELARLARTQAQILENAACLLKRGGRLVYSTCSLEPEENEAVINQFLPQFTEFALVKQRALLPFRDQVDGAFVAVLERKNL